MADIIIDTSAPAYTTRHAQFQQIVQFWGPILKEYFNQRLEAREAWRENDPFLNDLLRFAERVAIEKDEGITDV
jgi:hypothetical protein